MSNTALLLIDFQNDYFPSYEGAKWALSETEKAAEKGAQIDQDIKARTINYQHLKRISPMKINIAADIFRQRLNSAPS
ncbi:hypothetical protein OH492_15685 [Vibrio chagasii]|nr:hypothetical protein [Vibrio chagasii]